RAVPTGPGGRMGPVSGGGRGRGVVGVVPPVCGGSLGRCRAAPRGLFTGGRGRVPVRAARRAPPVRWPGDPVRTSRAPRRVTSVAAFRIPARVGRPAPEIAHTAPELGSPRPPPRDASGAGVGHASPERRTRRGA